MAILAGTPPLSADAGMHRIRYNYIIDIQDGVELVPFFPTQNTITFSTFVGDTLTVL